MNTKLQPPPACTLRKPDIWSGVMFVAGLLSHPVLLSTVCRMRNVPCGPAGLWLGTPFIGSGWSVVGVYSAIVLGSMLPPIWAVTDITQPYILPENENSKPLSIEATPHAWSIGMGAPVLGS